MQRRSLAVLLLAVTLPLPALAAESYTVDPAHTFPHFSVNHLGFSTVQGRFDKTSGKVTLDRAAKTGSVDIAIQADSISTGFAKRDEHLMSPDFFNAAEFPTITYQSSSMTFKGDTPASVNGKLSLLGVTKPVTLTIDAFKCGTNPMNKKEECGAAASAQIKRSDFGMKAFLPGVGDDIKLVFEIEAYKD
ncbi:MAG: polyisoprenoid-binding protein [Sideroxydans sp.]|nr:polyisoprenoid-binding protein [Sideroxydans sp.]